MNDADSQSSRHNKPYYPSIAVSLGIEDLLRRPGVPVTRSFIDLQLNRSNDKNIREEINVALMWMHAIGNLGRMTRHTPDTNVYFWLIERQDEFPADYINQKPTPELFTFHPREGRVAGFEKFDPNYKPQQVVAHQPPQLSVVPNNNGSTTLKGFDQLGAVADKIVTVQPKPEPAAQPEPQPMEEATATAPQQPLSMDERIQQAVGTAPMTKGELAGKLGVPITDVTLARRLGFLVSKGRVVKLPDDTYRKPNETDPVPVPSKAKAASKAKEAESAAANQGELPDPAAQPAAVSTSGVAENQAEQPAATTEPREEELRYGKSLLDAGMVKGLPVAPNGVLSLMNSEDTRFSITDNKTLMITSTMIEGDKRIPIEIELAGPSLKRLVNLMEVVDLRKLIAS